MSFLPKRSIYTNVYSRKYIRFQKGNAFRFTQCAQNQTERRAINFLIRQSFRFFISAVRFHAYSTSRKNDRRSKSRTMRVFASEYDFYRGSTNRRGRPIVPRDCGGRLSWIKGIKGGWRRLPANGGESPTTWALCPPSLRLFTSPFHSIFEWSESMYVRPNM